MDLKKLLAKEHSKDVVIRIVKYVGTDKNRFFDLVSVYLQGPYRITQRAAWPLSYCVEAHPELVKPHLKLLLNFLEKPGIHNAVKRNTVRLLQFVAIPVRYHDRVLSLCFQYLQNKKEPVAVKVFAMTVLSRLVTEYPDLKNELRIIIEDQLPYATPAFCSRAQKILKEMKSLN